MSELAAKLSLLECEAAERPKPADVTPEPMDVRLGCEAGVRAGSCALSVTSMAIDVLSCGAEIATTCRC